jgi:cullin-associated NEDD8-dissociated protein 1
MLPPFYCCACCYVSRRASISALKVCPSCGPAVKEYVLPNALALSASSLLQDVALESLLALLEQVVASSAIEFQDLLSMLRSRVVEGSGKHTVYNIARCIAVITAATSSENCQSVVTDTLNSLNGTETPEDPAGLKNVQLALLVSGELGRIVDLSTLGGTADSLQGIYMGYFESPSEDLKYAAAYALGRAAVGAQSKFLPAIVDALEKNNQKKQYLLLSALRGFIQCSYKQSGGDSIAASLPVIMPHLETHAADTEEGVRTMVAECLGSLICMQPGPVLERVQALVSSHSAITVDENTYTASDDTSKVNVLVCWTAASSLKLAISGKADPAAVGTFMPNLLSLLQQKELSVRNAALLMVYSAVHHMPQLVSSEMKELIMPTLYEVAELKLERKVDLGPFKHTVDDALPLRKAALSIFATCLENLPASLDIAAFIPVLAKALGDVEDVQLQAHQILISMCTRQPTYLVAAIETLVDPLEKTIHKKQGQKTGTELERLNDWIKSALRAILALSKLEGAMNNRKFAEFKERTFANIKFSPVIAMLEEER